MIEEIGRVAGEVWAHLNKNGETTLAQLKRKVSGGADLVNLAVGWLAREEKLTFDKKGRTIKVALKE